jgi:hypothetical protein
MRVCSCGSESPIAGTDCAKDGDGQSGKRGELQICVDIPLWGNPEASRHAELLAPVTNPTLIVPRELTDLTTLVSYFLYVSLGSPS